jgi:hypothetical protein
MATLTEIANLHGSGSLRSRVMAAIAKASQDIINEAPETPSHAARLIWAKESLLNADSAAEKMMWAVVGNASIQATGENCTDNDVKFVVNSNVNQFI